jgi:hypothetical protein
MTNCNGNVKQESEQRGSVKWNSLLRHSCTSEKELARRALHGITNQWLRHPQSPTLLETGGTHTALLRICQVFADWFRRFSDT